MARTPRCRRIRCYPDYWSFAPQDEGQAEVIEMTLDEYECIRLMDREKLTQERCAERMGVARTTVTNIYENARTKLAEALVDGKILRIGGGGARVDNIGAGGYSCAINPDGSLSKRAVNRKSEWVESNQDGLRFETVTVPNYAEAVALVKKMHTSLPHFKIVGWDIGISKDGEPTLIEFNSNPGQNQYSCGPTFGDLTDRVLEDVFIKKSLINSRN